MRIARLLIYEGNKADLEEHFRLAFVRPGEGTRSYSNAKVTVSEDDPRGAGGRVELQEGEIAAIKVVK